MQKGGIEPIVAAILLIVITVVAAVLLYMWFSGYLTATTGKVSSMSSPEEFQVVAVSLSASNGLNAIRTKYWLNNNNNNWCIYTEFNNRMQRNNT